MPEKFIVLLISLSVFLAWCWRQENLISRARLRSNNSLSDECDRLEAEKQDLNGQIVMLREALRSQAAVTAAQSKTLTAKPSKPRRSRVSQKGRW